MTGAPVPEIAYADKLQLEGVRPWSAPGLLADSVALNAAIPENARGAIVAYGERDQVGKIGASLALLYRLPAGLTFMGRLDKTWNKPLKATVTIAKVF